MSEPRSTPYKAIGLALAILLLATIPRVWALDVFITPDEHRWVRRSGVFLEDLVSAMPQKRLADRFPGVTTRWTGTAGLLLSYGTQPPADAETPPADLPKFLSTLDPYDPSLLPAMRLPTALLTAVCVAILYLLMRRLFGEGAALVAGVLLALDPFLIGLSRVIHHDALVTSFIGIAVLSFLAYLGEEQPRAWLLLLAGVGTALALLSKATAGFLLPYTAFVAAASCLHWDGASPRLDRARIRCALVGLVGWALITLVVVVALWPAMWVDSPGTLQQIFNQSAYFAETPHELGNYFLGQPVDDPGLLFYPVAFLLRATPLTLLGLLASLLLLRNRARRDPQRRWGFYLFASWAFILLFVTFMGLGAKKFDRYILPVILFADIVAGIGLVHLLELLRLRLAKGDRFTITQSRRLVSGLGVALVLLLQVGPLWIQAPYYLTYYNPLLGGSHVAAAAIPVGWGEGCDLAAHYMNQKDNATDLDVAAWYAENCFGPLFEGTAWEIQTQRLNAVERDGLPWYATDYVVLYVNQVQRNIPTSAFVDFFRAREPEYVAQIGGFDYAWVYKVPETIPENVLPTSRCPIYEVPAGNFDNQVWLRNYGLGDADFRKKEVFTAGETVHLALQWRTERPLVNQYKVFAHAYDSQGRLVMQADDLLGGWDRGPNLQVLPSKTIMNYLTLTLPAATPPGDYALAVGLYDAVTGRRLGLLDEVGQATGTTASLGEVAVMRPATPPAIAELLIQHPLEVKLPEGLTLLGYDLMPAEGRAGEPLSVALYWQAQRDGLADLTVGLELRDAASKVWARQAGPPADGTYPTTRWIAGEIIRDTHDLTVDAAAPPGNLRLVLLVGGSEVPLTTVPIVGRQHVFQAPAISHPMTIDLEGARFLGYDLASTTVQPGEPMEITLYWQCLAKMETSYKVFVHLVDAEYETWGQVDRIPCAGECPTTSWLPGEYLVETYQLVPKPGTPPGTYRIAIGLYDDQTGARLPRVDGAGDHILLDAVVTVQGP